MLRIIVQQHDSGILNVLETPAAIIAKYLEKCGFHCDSNENFSLGKYINIVVKCNYRILHNL